MEKIFYFEECHGCGETFIAWPDEEPRTICLYCGDPLVDSGKQMSVRDIKSYEREQWQQEREKELYDQYIVNNPENEAKYQKKMKTKEYDRKQVEKAVRMQQEAERQRQAIEEANRPRCPACGSTNIRETVDLLPANGNFLRRKYYLCYSCGYKWRRYQ